MKALSILLTSLLITQPFLAQNAKFSINSNVVIVNVTVLDRNGKPLGNLTKDDFQLYEDGKLQKLQAVDFQQLTDQPLPPPGQVKEPEPPTGYNPEREKAAAGAQLLSKYQDRRLLIMFFDFGSMQPAEQIRSREAAIKFLTTQMTPSDMVSIMTYGSQLKTVQDFTPDRDLLIATINKFRAGDSSENATFADEGADSQDQSGQFVADETEFNIFNADLKLAALEDAARSLAQYPEKKAIIYISSGIQKNGVDNQSQLRATVNTAVRANVAFYPIDARGLSALIPGGDVTQQGAVGNNLYSGAGQNSLRNNFVNQQETLATLAIDTGGKALLDSNDLTEGMRQVQKDFSSYYILSYVSSNTAMDGRYRRIQVKLSPRVADLHARLDYRQGYYGPTTFRHMSESDKEAQLSQALMSDNPVTDLPIAVEIDYFRVAKNKYFAPISVKIPGSALVFHGKGAKQATELDFITEVFDARNRSAATVRDTIPLNVRTDIAGQVMQKSIQYDTGVTLTPGAYKLRFLARENGEGKVGTFESPFSIPDLATARGLKTSSLILSSQRDPVGEQVAGVKNSKKVLSQNPLIEDGQKLVPNVTKVFHQGQELLAYVEVYDPKIPDGLPENFWRADVDASLALYRENKKLFESQPVRATRLSQTRDDTLPVRLQIPVSKLAPGEYQCQVNLIDEFGRKFAFPRTRIAVLAPSK
ncbi:MAG: VWA domain-containing protein [Acidobacteriaceae bacterium]|nr:VWA domain-containing protein [Acidobacteriaceae bacterium]MBV8572350.1 VWA domain-containing protein [Acidobacteriaceae bacterium]